MHNWKSHEQRIGRHPQEHRTVFLFHLSSNQKLLQMQEYTHVLMQLRTGSPPYVPYDAPVPQACKQVLNACPIETMNIIVLRYLRYLRYGSP
mmetsp:Transcript_27731/g.45886  ORF Transcript_27731/g.45886 Transcript_27731/m.45886 type:complete len:92 (+) Transcript_27731:208-483(+)